MTRLPPPLPLLLLLRWRQRGQAGGLLGALGAAPDLAAEVGLRALHRARLAGFLGAAAPLPWLLH